MINLSERMQEAERHLEISVSVRCFDFSGVSELTSRKHPA